MQLTLPKYSHHMPRRPLPMQDLSSLYIHKEEEKSNAKQTSLPVVFLPDLPRPPPSHLQQRPNARHHNQEARPGENRLLPRGGTLGHFTRRGATQVPAADIGQLALLRQHGRIGAHVRNIAAERSKVGVVRQIAADFPPISITFPFPLPKTKQKREK